MSDKAKLESRKSFDFMVDENTTKKYYIGMPSSEHIRKAEWHYSKVYNKALVDGVSTLAEMTDILRSRNIIGPEYERKLEELNMSIALRVNEMQEAKEDLDKTKLALEIRQLRDKLFQWNQRAQGPLSNTCEQIADDAKTECLTACMIQEEDGSLVWDSFDEFVSEENQRLAIKSRFEVLLLLQGLDADFLEKTPEALVLKEIADAQKEREARQLKSAAEESERKADEAVEAAEEAITVSKRKRSAKRG